MRKIRSLIAVVLFRIAEGVVLLAKWIRPNVDEAEYVRLSLRPEMVAAAVRDPYVSVKKIGTISVGSPMINISVKTIEKPDYELHVVDKFEDDISRAISDALKDEVEEKESGE